MVKIAAMLRQALASWLALALSLDPSPAHTKQEMMSSALLQKVSLWLAPAMAKHKAGLQREARRSRLHDSTQSFGRGCPSAAKQVQIVNGAIAWSVRALLFTHNPTRHGTRFGLGCCLGCHGGRPQRFVRLGLLTAVAIKV